MSYWDDLQRHDGGTCVDEIWLNHPLVRAEANRRISGRADVWPAEWLAAQVPQTLDTGVSIGCGTGAFERDIARRGIVRNLTGIDLAAQPLARAREVAAESGLAISYECVDAAEWLQGKSVDAVFFHASLHHFENPARLLARVRAALRPGGILYLDEYVGPSRNEWSLARLIAPNVAYYLLPRRVRRPHLVRAPINREDPTEAIDSSAIVRAVRENFTHVVMRPYGGNLLSMIYPNLHRPPHVDRDTFDRAVARLIRFERIIGGAFYAVILAT